MKIKRVATFDGQPYGWRYACPWCKSIDRVGIHVLPVEAAHAPRWTFDGNVEAPTFSPSVLATGSFNGVETVCHHFVRAGRIEYLQDCTHALRGQTVDMVEFGDGST
jgi:hypothetical protein